MTTREKIQNMSFSEVLLFRRQLQKFDCENIPCERCPFSYSNIESRYTGCLMNDICEEYNKRRGEE